MSENRLEAALGREGNGQRVLFRLENASRVYRMGQVDVPALREATLDIYEGEIIVVVGPSGSGKSTMLNLVGGMDRPTSGTVSFRGEDLSRASDRRLTNFRRRQVGFIFQFFNLIPTLTALENVQVVTEIAEDPMDPLETLRLVGLEERASHFPAQLSGGEQQRVAIARAIARKPEVLLCDEPTGALDLESGVNVLDILERLNRDSGKSVIIVTHNGAIAGMAHRAVKLHDGRIASVDVNESPVPAAEVTW